jgi:hypothetical protein
VCDEVESVHAKRICEHVDPLYLGVVGGRRFRRSGAAEAGPVSGNDAVVFG